jgi:NAD(P)H-dependent FMN reductase
MKISIISGSHRHDSESARVAKYVGKELKNLAGDYHTHLVDLADNPLPLWDEEVWKSSAEWKNVWQPIAKELQSSDAFIVISPEWSGMVPAGLKNFFLLASAKELGHKPAMIIAVSSSTGGAYPVVELRTSSYKNTRICYIPEHVIIRDCTKVLHGDKPQSDADEYIRKRMTYSLKLLAEYGKAFKAIRDSGVIDLKTYPNGM